MKRLIRIAEAWGDRFFTHRLNPLPQSGAIVFLLLTVLTASGAILFLYYSVEFKEVHRSVSYLNEGTVIGFLARGMHRHAADLILVFAAVHMLRSLLLPGHDKARARSWLSGTGLLVFIIYQGVTGYILPWDGRGQGILQVVMEALSAIPFIGMEAPRAFLVNDDVTTRKLIYILALHLIPPVIALGLLGAHFQRLRRPRIWADRRLNVSIIAGLAIAAVAFPAASLEPADFLKIPELRYFDWLLMFPVVLMKTLDPGTYWIACFTGIAAFACVPVIRNRRNGKKYVVLDEAKCVGCGLCVVDCPFSAIDLDPLSHKGKHSWVAWIDKDRCVGCSICVGSCGFDALDMPLRPFANIRSEVAGFLEKRVAAGGAPVVVYACRNALDINEAEDLAASGAYDPDIIIVPLLCAGQLYSGWVEQDLINGATGVMIVRCGQNSCEGREGSKFVESRIYHERKPWLRKRVGRKKIRLVSLNKERSHLIFEMIGQFRKWLPKGAAQTPDREARKSLYSQLVPPLVFTLFVIGFAFITSELWGKWGYAPDGGSLGRITVSLDSDEPVELRISAGGKVLARKIYPKSASQKVVQIYEKIPVNPGETDITITAKTLSGVREVVIHGPVAAGQVVVVRKRAGEFFVVGDIGLVE